ncbi:MAG: hypothetical protein H7322_10680 [Ramlibacter sp.]|nr:hypothetical protein [Ramlibacter sp.]
MDETLSAVLANEEAKLSVLEREVELRRKRVAALKAAVNSMAEADDFDAVLAGKVGALKLVPDTEARPDDGVMAVPKPATKPPPTTLNPAAAWPLPNGKPLTGKGKQRKKGEVKAALLALLNRTPMHLTEVQGLAAAAGYTLNYNRVRAELWAYKNDGLVDSASKGYYTLNDQGEAYVERQKGESPVAPGLSDVTRPART